MQLFMNPTCLHKLRDHYCCSRYFSVSVAPFRYCRTVSDADVLSLEKRLMQTMDMIVLKKKRFPINL